MKLNGASCEVDDVEELVQGDDLDEWNALAGQWFGPLRCRPFSSQKTLGVGRRVSGSTVTDLLSAPCRIERYRKHLRAREMNSWRLCRIASGTMMLQQEGCSISVRQGDLYIYDMDREYSMDIPSRVRLTLVTLPKEALSLSTSQASLVACREIRRNPGVANSLALLMHSVSTDIVQCDAKSLANVNRAIAFLLSAALQENLGDRPNVEGMEEGLLPAVRQFISHHIAEPDLGPESIAEAFHMSTRNLYRLFEGAEVGIGAEIRTQRIRRCAEDLCDPAFRRENVSTIAARWGIYDASTFSRQFKSIFGVSPREYRNTARRTA